MAATTNAAPLLSDMQGEAQRAWESSLWHLLFFPALTGTPRELLQQPISAAPAAVAVAPFASTGDGQHHTPTMVSAVYSLALMQAVGFAQAGPTAQQLLTSCASRILPARWDSVKADTELTCVEMFSRAAVHGLDASSPWSTKSSTMLASVLLDTRRALLTRCTSAKRRAANFCDAMVVDLMDDCLSPAYVGKGQASERGGASLASPNRRSALFRFEGLSASAPGAAPAERSLGWRQQQWYEARLYATLACAASLATPGPLARLLVAYAVQWDGRLQAAVEANVNAMCADDADRILRRINETAEPSSKETSDAAVRAALADVRISGVVAGILEYTLCVARLRTAVAVAEVRDITSPDSPSQRPNASIPAMRERRARALRSLTAHTPQVAALLLAQVAEEWAHYVRTAPTLEAAAAVEPNGVGRGGGRDGAYRTDVSAALAVVHAVQELLYTVVGGCGTQHMPNRPEPAVAPLKSQGGATGGSVLRASPTSSTLLVSTTRSVSLQEADAITQQLFPTLLQQLGLEWVWSPLLRHLSSLDRTSGAPAAATATATLPLPVRWSSPLCMDAVLLSLARKTYPQRLLNLLPGSYERWLGHLCLLPPKRSEGDDQRDGERAAEPMVFAMPAYYAEPASALVTYLQRAGTAGLRLAEVERLLSTATSTHTMVVRLKAQAPRVPEEETEAAVAPRIVREDAVSEGREQRDRGSSARAQAASYKLARDRVDQLIARYQGEVLLAAVIVHTQLRVPSHVQQLLRVLAPLFLRIQLAWRAAHDGSTAFWLLRRRRSHGDAGGDSSSTTSPPAVGSAVEFSEEAALLINHVGYEFYPLEWLPAVLAAPSEPEPSLPYSLFAAVGHQFQVRLRGTPLGNSGDNTLRHPAGPRTSVALPAPTITHLPPRGGADDEAEAEASARAWCRTERFVRDLLLLCYLDSKTSSTELEGTLAVSSTRRVLTSTGGSTNLVTGSSDSGIGEGGRGGRSSMVASADLAAHRLRSLLQQSMVKDALWGAVDRPTSVMAGGSAQHGSTAQQREKRARSPPAAIDKIRDPLRSMRQLLFDYGAASFDTTVEAVDVALVIAQSFLPSSAGISASAPTVTVKGARGILRSDALLRTGLEWGHAVVRNPAIKTSVHAVLPQQQSSKSAAQHALALAYNSATIDTAWLARAALRHVPQRIWEKLRCCEAERYALQERYRTWTARRCRGEDATDVEDAPQGDTGHPWVDPLLAEQWHQWERVVRQLGLADVDDDLATVPIAAPSLPETLSADGMTSTQWLWYSPYFSAELRGDV